MAEAKTRHVRGDDIWIYISTLGSHGSSLSVSSCSYTRELHKQIVSHPFVVCCIKGFIWRDLISRSRTRPKGRGSEASIVCKRHSIRNWDASSCKYLHCGKPS